MQLSSSGHLSVISIIGTLHYYCYYIQWPKRSGCSLCMINMSGPLAIAGFRGVNDFYLPHFRLLRLTPFFAPEFKLSELFSSTQDSFCDSKFAEKVLRTLIWSAATPGSFLTIRLLIPHVSIVILSIFYISHFIS